MTATFNALAPWSMFGTVPVLPLWQQGDAPDWQPQPVIVRKHIPGGNVTITQFMGCGPLRYEPTLRLLSDADYQALRALLGTSATLRLVREASGYAGADTMIAGQSYVEFAAVTLVELGQPRRRRDGTVLCTAAFEREDDAA